MDDQQMTDETPRGIRNCNPCNIDNTGIKWQGMAAVQEDPRFITFENPYYGFRAAARILHGHWTQDNTVTEIISRWAPPSENNTTAYINAVCESMGVGPDDKLDYDTHIVPLLHAITVHEEGQCPYSDDIILQGVNLEDPALQLTTA